MVAEVVLRRVVLGLAENWTVWIDCVIGAVMWLVLLRQWMADGREDN